MEERKTYDDENQDDMNDIDVQDDKNEQVGRDVEDDKDDMKNKKDNKEAVHNSFLQLKNEFSFVKLYKYFGWLKIATEHPPVR